MLTDVSFDYSDQNGKEERVRVVSIGRRGIRRWEDGVLGSRDGEE